MYIDHGDRDSKVSQGNYTFNSLPKEFLNMENWYSNKSEIEITNPDNTIVFQSRGDKAGYVSLLEDNTNFAFITPDHNKLLLNHKNTIEITGEKSPNVNIIIYLIEYDARFERIKRNRLKFNGATSFVKQPSTMYARIAIRILGEGELCIKHIFTSHYIPEEFLGDIKENRYLSDIHVAAILDEHSGKGFSDVVSLTQLSTKDWEVDLHMNKPDFLFVESAWAGNNGSWKGLIEKNANNDNNDTLSDLILWCKTNKIPTVFWNNEDPINFDTFKYAASLFDFVFTIDQNMIPKYKEHLCHQHVNELLFAATPQIGNKIKTPGLYCADGSGDVNLESINNVKPSVFSFRAEGKSTSIIPRQLIEDLAGGKPVICDSLAGIKRHFHDVVLLSENTDQMKNHLRDIMQQDELFQSLSMKGIRKIFREHTYAHRMEFMLEQLHIPFQMSTCDVTILFSVDSREAFDKAVRIIESQTFNKLKAILLISPFTGFEEIFNTYSEHNRITIYLEEYAYLHYKLPDLVKTKYLTVLQPELIYDKHIIEDGVNAIVNLSAKVVGRKAEPDKGEYPFADLEYEGIKSIKAYTALFELNSIEAVGVEELVTNQREELEKLLGKISDGHNQ